MERKYVIIGAAALAIVILMLIAIAMFSGGSVEGAGAATAVAGAAAASARKALRDQARTELDDIAESAEDASADLESLRDNHDANSADISDEVNNTSISDLISEENERS